MKTIKPIDKLEFTDNFMFCKVLTLRPDLCEELLQVILGKPIHIVKSNQEYAITITPEGKGIRMDVYVEGDNNNIYDLEMQVTNNNELAKRSRFYQGIIDMNSIQRGDPYTKLKDSCIIFICTFDYFNEGLPIYHFQQRCEANPSILLDDGTSRYFLNPYSNSDGLSDDLKNFLKFLINKKPTDTLTEALQEEVNTLKHDPKIGIEYMSFNAHITDAFTEGEEKGRAEGKAEGKAEGRLNEIYESVEAGDYSIERGAEKANLSVSEFEKAMTNAGYQLPVIQ